MFKSFYCYSYDCWGEEAGSGEEEIPLVTDVLELIGNSAQMTLHCRSSAGTGNFCLENRYKLGQQGSSLALFFVPVLRALPIQLCRFNEEISVAGTTSQIT